MVARFTVEGEPRSKERPRLGKNGNTYTPEATAAAEQLVAWKFREAARGYEPDAYDLFGLSVVFYEATRKRRDLDNMLKLIGDGLNEIAWVDDSSIVEMSGRKVFVNHKALARTEIFIYKAGRAEKPAKKGKR